MAWLPFNDTFDLPRARTARDAGMAQAAAHASPSFKAATRAAIARVAAQYHEFTTDHVWQELGRMDAPSTHERRALGPLMQEAKIDGLITPLSQYVQSRRVVCHGRMVRLWKSNTYR